MSYAFHLRGDERISASAIMERRHKVNHAPRMECINAPAAIVDFTEMAINARVQKIIIEFVFEYKIRIIIEVVLLYSIFFR